MLDQSQLHCGYRPYSAVIACSGIYVMSATDSVSQVLTVSWLGRSTLNYCLITEGHLHFGVIKYTLVLPEIVHSSSITEKWGLKFVRPLTVTIIEMAN